MLECIFSITTGRFRLIGKFRNEVMFTCALKKLVLKNFHWRAAALKYFF